MEITTLRDIQKYTSTLAKTTQSAYGIKRKSYATCYKVYQML